MKRFKRVLSIALSVAMLGSAMTAMAADPTGNGGTGNVLDYTVETVVVPTQLKVALNPNGYPINTKYTLTADTALDEDKTYYTKGGTDEAPTYAVVTDPDVNDIDTYYEATQSNAQVVSLNYGIANKSTEAKNITVKLAISYDDNAEKEPIEFVDTADKATFGTGDDNAKRDELKMYLAIASASALPTANTYGKTADTSLGSNKTYYTKGGTDDAPTFAKVASPDVKDIKTYFEETTTIGPWVVAKELSDVGMTAATVENAVFAPGDNKANAEISYNLGAATRAVKAGEIVDFDTTQSQLADKLELTGIGGIAGFTLIGAINEEADWTKAETDALVITPTYKLSEISGEEVALTGTYNQVSLAPADVAPSIAVTEYSYTAGQTVEVTVDLGSGNLAATGVADVKFVAGTGPASLPADYWSYSNGKVTFAGAYTTALGRNNTTRTHTIVFNDEEGTTIDIVLAP